MEAAAKRNKLDVVAEEEDEDHQSGDVKMFRKQETAHTQQLSPPERSSQDEARRISRRRRASTNTGPQGSVSSTLQYVRVPATAESSFSVPGSRRIRAGYVSLFDYQLRCKSPSTDSTTSLAQLRDRLTILSPLIFERNNQRIACSPDLPAIKELDERSASQSNIHCGLITKRQNQKPTRDLAVVDAHVPSLLLSATLDSSADEATKNDICNKMFQNNEQDLFDILVGEALQHSEKNDVSGAAKDDVVEKPRHKLSLKRDKVQDESDEAIDDTPCYVSDRRKVRYSMKEKIPENRENSEHGNPKTNMRNKPNNELNDCIIVEECLVEKELEVQGAYDRDINVQSKASSQGSIRSKTTRTDQEQGLSSRVPQRVRAGVLIHKAIHYGLKYRPNSASTDSTSSLLQLRDTLTVLSPLKFSKGPRKIASSPKLPALKEDDQEHLSNSLSQVSCKSALNSHSDTEAQVPKKKTSLSTIVEERSTRVVSRETLDLTDESAKNNLIGKSDKDYNFDINLADLLIEEALKHSQEKDSNATRHKDAVENTNVERNVRHEKVNTKQNTKSKVVDDPLTDNSEVEIIDDTPCYVYDRKEKVRSVSSKPVNKIVDDENQTLDDKSVDVFFSQHNPENLTISPTLTKKTDRHSKDTDSGVIWNKATQDRDVVESTPVEHNVRKKRVNKKHNTKSKVVDNPPGHNSEVEVIDDTPCYVFDRREKVRSNSLKTVNKVFADEIPTFDEKAIDELFSQHLNYNDENLVISPTLAKKVNETSSEASDDEWILDVDKKIKENNFVIDADIVDCVNSIIDRVCNDLEQYCELITKQEHQIDLLGSAKDIDVSPNNSPNKSKRNKDIETKKEKITLKFKPSKKMTPTKNTRKRAKKTVKNLNLETKRVLRERTNINSPINTTEATATRKKRRLYSPKDDENANNESPVAKTRAERTQSNVNQTPIATCYRELENIRKSCSISRTSRASSRSKKNSKKTHYIISPECSDKEQIFSKRKHSISSNKESPITRSKSKRSVEPARYTDFEYPSLPSSSSEDEAYVHNRSKKPKMVRKSKARPRKIDKKSRSPPILSPKTKRLNEMFDSIKRNIVNDEKITLVQKKNAKDFSLYNLSSESDDDFKISKIQVQKRISSSSLESSATKRQRLTNRVNYSKYYSTTSEDEGKKTRKPKMIKQVKSRSRKLKDVPKDTLVDEKMRNEQQETLDTSFVKETADTNTVHEPEPQLEQAPGLEVMLPEKLLADVTEVVVLENKTTPDRSDLIKIKKENYSSKKCGNPPKTTGTKKGTELGKEESKEKDNAQVSPLPGLVVETERTGRTWKDDLTSSLEADLLQKFKTIYTGEHDFNEINGTQQELNIKDNTNVDRIEDLGAESDVLSGKTIATDGRSPIRGHNESPPTLDLLNENFEHRDIHTEGLSMSLTEFLNNMRYQLQTKPSTGSEASLIIPNTKTKSAGSNVCAKKALSDKSSNAGSITGSNQTNPTVILRKLSSKEIESHFDPARTPKSRVSRVSSVVITRMSSEEIETYLTPKTTKKSSEPVTPTIVLERISPSEINKWLPLPCETNKNPEEEPGIYTTRRRITSKSTDVKNISSGNVIGKRNNTNISPVKLSFDVVDLTKYDGRKTPIRTRSSTRSIKCRVVNMNTEPVKMNSEKTVAPVSDVNNIQTINKEPNIKSSQETIKSSNTTKRTQKDIQEKAVSSVDLSEVSKSIASVQDWFKRNDVPSSPTGDNQALKEISSHVTEALQTTLAEIHHNTGERWTSAFMAEQEEMTCLEKEMLDIVERHNQQTLSILRVQKMIEKLKKNKQDRACEVIRIDAENKSRMVRLLQEDIDRALKMN